MTKNKTSDGSTTSSARAPAPPPDRDARDLFSLAQAVLAYDAQLPVADLDAPVEVDGATWERLVWLARRGP